MKKSLKQFFTILLGIFMVYGGVIHLIKPDFYLPFVPYFLPFREEIIAISGVFEILVGLGVLIPRFRSFSALVVVGLMLIFLPIHIWDVFRSDPAIGNHTAAMIRVPVQVVFIAWSLWIATPFYKFVKASN